MSYVIAKGDDRQRPSRANVSERIRAVVPEIETVESRLGATYESASYCSAVSNPLNTLIKIEVSATPETTFAEHSAGQRHSQPNPMGNL